VHFVADSSTHLGISQQEAFREIFTCLWGRWLYSRWRHHEASQGTPIQATYTKVVEPGAFALSVRENLSWEFDEGKLVADTYKLMDGNAEISCCSRNDKTYRSNEGPYLGRYSEEMGYRYHSTCIDISWSKQPSRHIHASSATAIRWQNPDVDIILPTAFVLILPESTPWIIRGNIPIQWIQSMIFAPCEF